MTQGERAGLEALKRTVGNRRAERISYLYRDRFQPAVEALTYRLADSGRRSRQRLEELRDRYRGERCFIIGNGPSLANTDLAKLRHEYTFGLNRGYLLFDRIGGPTTFLVAVNRYVVEQFGAELLSAGSTTFISWRSRHAMPKHHQVIFIRRSRLFTFSQNLATHGGWEGGTVTYIAMQLAFHLGFQEVILVGVDHSFTTTGPANQLVTSEGADPNHFDPTYFGAGVRWQLPDLETSEIAYRLARHHFETHDRVIVDATVDGNLRVFARANYAQIHTRPGLHDGRVDSP